MLRFLRLKRPKSLAPSCPPRLPCTAGAQQHTPSPTRPQEGRRPGRAPEHLPPDEPNGVAPVAARCPVSCSSDTGHWPSRPSQWGVGGGARETSWKVPLTHESVRPQLSPRREPGSSALFPILSTSLGGPPPRPSWGSAVSCFSPGVPGGGGCSPGNLGAPPAPGQSQGVSMCLYGMAQSPCPLLPGTGPQTQSPM